MSTPARLLLLRTGKGSHEIWSNGRLALTVPFHCKSRHTANGILKDADIDHKI
ncbi:type II toxin-antitoxin system HicA family toxin [Massilia arenosa]|uniref:Type II toxin-antitoxin system HicA family toxin n=1 Tax=Zemynaea arenosa TaxID=2561931 RepID=A0A4Y9RR65_9BURK|nr:type II toxin-antitoxin system HicA family toxin [Massilia arenosa]